jgi:hypothetical protein
MQKLIAILAFAFATLFVASARADGEAPCQKVAECVKPFGCDETSSGGGAKKVQGVCTCPNKSDRLLLDFSKWEHYCWSGALADSPRPSVIVPPGAQGGASQTTPISAPAASGSAVPSVAQAPLGSKDGELVELLCPPIHGKPDASLVERCKWAREMQISAAQQAARDEIPPPATDSRGLEEYRSGLDHLALIGRGGFNGHFVNTGMGGDLNLEAELGLRWQQRLVIAFAFATGVEILDKSDDVLSVGGRGTVLYDPGNPFGFQVGGAFVADQFIDLRAGSENQGRGYCASLRVQARYATPYFFIGADLGPARCKINEPRTVNGEKYLAVVGEVAPVGSLFLGVQIPFVGGPASAP